MTPGAHEGRPYDRRVRCPTIDGRGDPRVALSLRFPFYAINRCTSADSLEYVKSAS